MEDSTNHEFGAPEEEYHEHYEEDEITPEHSQEIEEVGTFFFLQMSERLWKKLKSTKCFNV